ncbi:MAG: hypothetical protein AAGL69_13620 [Pseudomonadota bacterium]
MNAVSGSINESSARAYEGASRRVWLPELAYEALPYCYILIGFSALFTSLYISEWYWIVPHCILLAAASLHAGASILVKRQRARSGDGEFATST